MEREEFLGVIHRLVACSGAVATVESSQLQPLVARAADILEKYQEQPTLLDKHLADAVRMFSAPCIVFTSPERGGLEGLSAKSVVVWRGFLKARML